MTVPRSWVVNDDVPSAFHLVSRCVRRAFLCGDASAHRQEWLRNLVRDCAASFAIDVFSYAFMQNHFHLVVHTKPRRVESWSAFEVAQRWLLCHPKSGADGNPVAWNDAEIQAFANDSQWIEKQRHRLKSISWFMKTIKESVARRANREDHCTGHFWEARFKSSALLDAPSIVACMAYVDLNPIRAGVAKTPEESPYTSVKDRITCRQRYRKAVESLTTLQLSDDQRTQCEARKIAGPQSHPWLAKLDPSDRFPLKLDDYLTIVDATGRIVRGDKRGHIPPELLPILKRLDLDVQSWISLMQSGGQMQGSAIGRLASRTAEALRRTQQAAASGLKRSCKWIVNTCGNLFGDATNDPQRTISTLKTPPEPAAG